MSLLEMTTEIARNLVILSDDESTIISSKVTETGIHAIINRIYRDRIAQSLIDKYPGDFTQQTYQRGLYRASFTVSTQVGAVITSGSAVFSNRDQEFYIQNPTTSEIILVKTFTNATTIELNSEPSTSWVGNTCYILDNEFLFDGDASDAREITEVLVKYRSTERYYTRAERRNLSSLSPLSAQEFNSSYPIWYITTIQTSEGNSRGFGILPFPTTYDGLLEIRYTERPDKLINDSDELQLRVAGLEEVIILGGTAWGYRMLGDRGSAQEYQADYNAAFKDLINSYKPKSRSGPSRIRFSGYLQNMIDRTI
jgi:hypothetical protein